MDKPGLRRKAARCGYSVVTFTGTITGLESYGYTRAEMLQEEKRIRLKDGSLATIKGNARSLDGELSCRTLPDVTGQRRLEKEILDLSLRQELEIVRDLHDVWGQTLIAVSLSARTLISALGSAKPAAQDAAQLEALITEAVTQMRALARGSSPSIFQAEMTRPWL